MSIIAASWAAVRPGPMSDRGPGCVKTCPSQGRLELFSQSPSSDRSCQCNWFLHRRNRDGNSTRRLGVGVFTQPGSKGEILMISKACPLSPLKSGHRISAFMSTGPLAPEQPVHQPAVQPARRFRPHRRSRRRRPAGGACGRGSIDRQVCLRRCLHEARQQAARLRTR